MPAEIAERAAASRRPGIEPPGERRLGIGEIVLGVPAAKAHRAPETARAHDVDGVADEWHAQIGEADAVGDAGAGGGGRDRARLGGAAPDRLLAQDMLAERQSLQRDLAMHEARRRDDHRVDLADGGLPVAAPGAEAELRGLALGQRRIEVDEDARFGSERRRPEDAVHRLDRQAMDAADEARSDQCDANDALLHGALHRSRDRMSGTGDWLLPTEPVACGSTVPVAGNSINCRQVHKSGPIGEPSNGPVGKAAIVPS